MAGRPCWGGRGLGARGGGGGPQRGSAFVGAPGGVWAWGGRGAGRGGSLGGGGGVFGQRCFGAGGGACVGEGFWGGGGRMFWGDWAGTKGARLKRAMCLRLGTTPLGAAKGGCRNARESCCCRARPCVSRRVRNAIGLLRRRRNYLHRANSV